MADVSVGVLQDRQSDLTCKKLVAEACERWPSCKGSYTELNLRVSAMCGVRSLRDYFNQLEEHLVYSPETVGRRYRELVEEDPVKFAPSAATLAKRAKRERVMKRYYGRRKAVARRLDEFME